MSRKLAYKDLESQLVATAKERDVCYLAVTYLGRGDKPDGEERVHSGDCSYRLRLYGATRANGGIILVTFKAPNQEASTSVYYFEDYVIAYWNAAQGDLSDEAFKIREAIGRLITKRNALWRAEGVGL